MTKTSHLEDLEDLGGWLEVCLLGRHVAVLAWLCGREVALRWAGRLTVVVWVLALPLALVSPARGPQTGQAPGP